MFEILAHAYTISLNIESQGRVHTSTATVAVMPECDEVDVQIDAKDIEMSTCTVDSVVLEVRM